MGNMYLQLIIGRQRSCEKVMFSVVSVHKGGGERGHSEGGLSASDHYPWYIEPHCTGPLTQTWNLTVKGIPQPWPKAPTSNI